MTDLQSLEETLWKAADQLRVDGGIKASKYSTTVLGLIFLRFASIKYNKYAAEIKKEHIESNKGRNPRTEQQIAIEKCGFYLPINSRFEALLNLSESENIPLEIKKAMEDIETYNPELEGALPKDEFLELVPSDENRKNDYSLAKNLLKTISNIPDDISGDLFGKVYEYFLGKFALKEGQGGGQFFTPTSVVKLMVEMIEPYGGRILDPACGSGGMFVQSSEFIKRHRNDLKKKHGNDLIVCGVEYERETVKIAKMNMFLNGLRNDIRCANSYYDDPHNCLDRFDFVLANPPFNVDDVNLDKVKNQERFNRYGIPQNKSDKGKSDSKTVPNANYLWINLFASSLNEKGRAALVMANVASDARETQADIRRNLIKSGIISGMLSLPTNMFYTVTLPASIWFFDKAERDDKRILFINAQNIFRQIDRRHREFTDEQIKNITCIKHLFKGNSDFMKNIVSEYEIKISELKNEKKISEKKLNEAQKEANDFLNDKKNNGKSLNSKIKRNLSAAEDELKKVSEELEYFCSMHKWIKDRFPNYKYENVKGLCYAATLEEIEAQDWSLNPGRYVGVVVEEDGLTLSEFKAEMKNRAEVLYELNLKADKIMKKIKSDLSELIG